MKASNIFSPEPASGDSQAPRDDHLHDLVAARIDAHDASVAVEPRDRIFVHIAVAAEQLQAAVDDLALHLGDPELGHRGGGGVERALEIALDAMIVKHARDRRLGLALGEHELAVLELDDELAERL